MIRNITRNTIVAENIVKANKFKDRLFGLLVNKDIDGLILKTRFGIHTFLLKNTLDVLVIDENKKVVKIREDLRPHKIFIWPPIYKTVIELKKGSIKSSNTQLGDQLEF